ncbi:hypothetical protein ABT275_40970 [Streptomyces sp. NPDC001185]|uniref:hypothetical protein n=1 Tax=Streptomyces sp. NPDC001185 TaxID=3154380 RepID=UPI003320BC71
MKSNASSVEGPDGLVYTARLHLLSTTLSRLATMMRGHLKKIGSRRRRLSVGRIAGIMLVVSRCDQWSGDFDGGNGVHRTTVIGWVGR